MSEQTTQTDARTREDVVADAVRVLTEAARLTRPVYESVLPDQPDQAATSVDEEPFRPTQGDLIRDEPPGADVQDVRRYVETGRREPADFAEFVAQALVAAAANVGGVEAVLAGRPGSWEADAVRQLLVGTVGSDAKYLLEHRTEPVVVRVFVEEILNDLGVWDRYDDALRVLSDRAVDLDLDAPEQDELAAAGERLEQDRQRTWAEYGEALRAHIEATAAARSDLRVPVEVVVDLVTLRTPDEMTGSGWLGIEDELLQAAREAVPVPSGPTVE